MSDVTMGSHRRTVGVRRGGRSARVVQSVIDAVVAELARSGYGALRVDDVAALAGVNKTTIYRRWPTKSELVGEALRSVAGHHEPVPDTGSLRGDLVELVQRALAFVRTDIGGAVSRFITLGEGCAEVDVLAAGLKEESFARRMRVIDRAKARGELPKDAPAQLILDAIFAPVFSRTLRFNEIVGEATVVSLVDLVVTGAERGGGRKGEGRM
ncbi:MAG: TetR/AcrR family transcriptional regulator [Polyangiaceae bacterium]|nr:TetR/AcrR family transcriptional regulator [Polyangiaceae bacterium]